MFFSGQSAEAIRCRVRYQRGLPCIVIYLYMLDPCNKENTEFFQHKMDTFKKNKGDIILFWSKHL